MSRAYESALQISFEVRGGLFVRQVHHWAALLFLAAMVAHMFRTFFTGAFRKPREANWVIGVLLIFVGTFEGFTGYSLPDDLLSGTGLRIASGITLSVPVIGTWAHWALFGGEFPGTEIIPRLYIIHVLLLPGRPARADRRCTSGWSGTRSTPSSPARAAPRSNVVGVRILPAFAAKGGAFFAVTRRHHRRSWAGSSRSTRSGTSARTTRRTISAGSQPDFYMGWFATAWPGMFPAWEIVLGDYRIPAAFWATAAFLPLLFVVAAHLPGDRAAS